MDNITPGSTWPTCYWHHSAPAVARCVSCGRNICKDCSTSIQYRHYCGACASSFLPYQYPAQPVQQQRSWKDFFFPTLKMPLVFPGATWGIWEAVLIFVISTIAAGGATLLIAKAFKNPSAIASLILLLFLSSVMLYIFLLGGTFVSVIVRHKGNLSEIGLKTKGFGKGLALGVGLGFPLYVGGVLLAYVSQLLISPSKNDVVSKSLNEISKGGISPWLIALLFISVVVLAPICEEIFFRGYLYPALRNRMGTQSAMIWNGVFFALVHFELTGFLSRALLGYGLSYIYEKNRTLAGPMVGHAIYNGVMMVLFLVFMNFV